jgi:hypothetical protein
MQATNDASYKRNMLERRDVTIILSAILFVINFMCFYFIWLYAFPGITGIMRLLLCWVGAYAFTWLMTYMTRGVWRLILTVIMLGVQYLVFHYRP